MNALKYKGSGFIVSLYWGIWNRSHARSLKISCKCVLHSYVNNSKESIIGNIKMEVQQPCMNSFKHFIKSCMNVIQLDNCNYKTKYEHTMEFIIEHL